MQGHAIKTSSDVYLITYAHMLFFDGIIEWKTLMAYYALAWTSWKIDLIHI